MTKTELIAEVAEKAGLYKNNEEAAAWGALGSST